MTATATYLGANGWCLDVAGFRVLVDPWLFGPLVFPPGPWLLKGEMPTMQPVPECIDLLLLTQGLQDHAHPETLSMLSKDLPVVGSAAAAKVAKRLGFIAVEALNPGESTERGPLQIRATAGAAVPAVENGYLLDWPGGSLYLEPHGVLDSSVDERPVQTVITPVVDLGLPLVGNFITGASVMPDLISRFQPQQVLASTTGGDVRFTGLISKALEAGGVSEASPEVTEGCALITPTVGEAIPLAPSPG
ncbi:metallo-hydrolase/oxidoreductase [Synechococcus sp. PROS-7-1]|uniref:MBL fold metallo-hydrolase n=1 Tax=Synechococcus sp. PROS-7-1 TaxID=1442556 RepID=UPI0016446871|nr:MBL fold metallo-hydrolase [Synechococcus sp. PROS-7-1]QNI85676.1 metallo-hydrolase/oxidoreductase [Synechococcus sp. PROS-7-1]